MIPKLFDFSAFPTLETEHLILREIRADDAAGIFAIRGDFAVTRYNFGAAYETIDRAQKLIEAMQQAYQDQSELRWGITLKNGDDAVIGMCGFNYWDRTDRRASIGYDLAQVHWGRGIMPAALRAVLVFGFEHMDLNRIEADSSAENTASIRLLLKLGFTREGLQRDQYFDEGRFWDLALFGLLRRDYQR
jgi:ribosomal-protein-alanine N-acetyltransferase